MKTVLRAGIVMAAAAALTAPAAHAEVADSAPGGFTVSTAATIAAAPQTVYRRVVEDVGRWWSPEHTFSGKASNLFIEGRPGGCFCERLPAAGGVRHMVVVFADPPKTLRMDGALGPLQALAVTGAMTWTFTPKGAGTEVSLVYTVGGYRPGGLAALAPGVNAVLEEQLARLKRFVETGRPTP